jgi:hypothetical protein
VIGRTYLERGRPVVVLTGFRLPSKACPLPPCPPWLRWTSAPSASGPRNVAIQRADGERVVRQFRGLRRPR